MRSYQRLLCILSVGCVCAAAGLLHKVEATVADPGYVATRANNDAATRKGFDHFYNLEYDKAIREFETAQQAHPDDPFALNHTLEALIFKELFRVGALDTEAYAGDSFLTKKLAAPLDPNVRDRVKQLSDQALALSQARLDKNPNDVDALYARGVTRGMRATYVGIAERAWFSALRSAVAARHDHERVLELDPNYVDAKVLVGADLYIVGSLNWPTRVAASMAGISGNKQKGLAYLRQASTEAHSEVASDAQIVYALFLRREQNYSEALQVVARMQTEFPRNALIAAEYAHLLNAAGHGQEAIAAYRKVIANCRSNVYSSCRLEVPAYGMGEALRGQRQYQEAAEAYELAASSSTADPELRQKATLSAGQMYDVLQKRDTALAKYRAVVAENSASGSADLARHYMKEAYKSP
ncbi:MAG: tetratricopeptide repeat protein [Candidatus Korobacteraceae bacterium]